MSELRVVFDTPAGSAPQLRIVPEGLDPALAAARPLVFELDEDDYAELRWYLEDYLDLPDHGSRVRAGRVEQRLADWSRRLHEAVFGETARAGLLAGLLEAPPPRLLTFAGDDPRVLRLPWELMADEKGSLAGRLTLRRQLPAARDARPFEAELPLRILLVVSRPDDLGFIDPRFTTRAMLDALQPLGAHHLDVDFCRPPTLAQLEERLRAAERARRPYAIVHFDGHGTYDKLLGLGVLCFERTRDAQDAGDKSRTHAVPAGTLGDLLSAHHVPLVILEACRSGQVDTLALRSVAPRLLAAGVGSVVAMSHAVHVEATRVLLDRFYRELVQGATVGEALGGGRAALRTQPHRWIERGPGGRTVELVDWFLPLLYQRGADPALVRAGGEPAPARPAQAAARDDGETHDVFLSHHHADQARVAALATRLRDRHGLRVWLDAWEARRGPVQEACVQGVAQSRVIAIVCTRAALASQWVAAERQWAAAKDPTGRNVVPVLLEKVDLPLDLKALLFYDLADPAHDDTNIPALAAAIGAPAARPTSGRQRQPPPRGAPGAFPRTPVHQFHGRARELHALERHFHRQRAVLLHAMGGMGKTALAREAAYWWTRTGLFPDGACFLSFEQGAATPERVASVLGTYLEGADFENHPQAAQLERARELFHERRVLMVWDNFESVLPQFDERRGAPLSASAALPALAELFDEWTEDERGQGRLLVTCRPAETPLARARRVELHGLERPDSLYLLYRVLQTAGVEPETRGFAREELHELLATLADHPLSIELVAPHLKDVTPREIVARFDELLASFEGDADVERNRSLLASLRFSTDRLSPAARAALPWLGLFRVGVFEHNLLHVSRIAPEAWDDVRAELEATALVRVESDVLLADRPYLRFHPTLPWAASVVARDGAAGAAAPPPSAEEPEIRARFVAVYGALDTTLRRALGGSQPRGAMEVLAREEANFRTAVEWAVADGQFGVAAPMGDTFRLYLERSNRLRERDRWAAWLAEAARQAPWSAAAAAAERDAAWALFAQGRGTEALRRLEALIERLSRTTEFDPRFHLALTRLQLGRTYDHLGDAPRAIPILREALGDWESLCEQAGVGALARAPSPSEPSPASPPPAAPPSGSDAAATLGNLSATLGDLANALSRAGQLDEALAVAERAAALARHLGRDRDVAAGLGQTASILASLGRYAEAEERYEQALEAARRGGDRELEATLLQHQGILATNRRQYERAAESYKQALKLFQEADDDEGVMQTCNSLGVVEQNQGRLAEARAWYERGREIAEGRRDTQMLGIAAQNLGIVCQQEGQQARQRGDDAAARQHFAQAERFLQESLRLKVERGDEPGQAASNVQLGQLYLLTGDLERADDHARRGREIHERLADLRGLSITYQTLKHIARARGDETQAAQWEAKEAAVDAELAHRAGGGDGPPPQLLEALGALAVACVQAAAHELPLPAGARQALDQLDSPEAGPLQPLAAYLRRLATTPPAQLAAALATPPTGLPQPLPRLFAHLHKQLASQ